MKQLPVNNAPANMQPWIRDIEAILKQHDSSLYSTTNNEVATNATLNRRSVNLKTNLAATNANVTALVISSSNYGIQLANLPARIQTGTGSIVCTAAGIFSSGITLTGFVNTPIVIAQLTVGGSSSNTPLTVSGATNIAATITVYRAAAITVTFNWIAIGS